MDMLKQVNAFVKKINKEKPDTEIPDWTLGTPTGRLATCDIAIYNELIGVLYLYHSLECKNNLLSNFVYYSHSYVYKDASHYTKYVDGLEAELKKLFPEP